MTTEADLSVADRLAQVLDHLGIERAHFAASMLADVAGFAQAHPERIASLTLVCPPRLDPSALRALGARLQIIAGDQGRPAAMVRDAVTSLPEATVVWLPGYFSPPWADVVADCTADIESAFLNVLSRDQPQKDRAVHGSLSGRCCRHYLPQSRRRPAPGAVTAEFSVLSMGPAAIPAQHAVSHGHAWRP